MPTLERKRARRPARGGEAESRLVAVIAAVLAVIEEPAVEIRIRPVWPDPGPWRILGRRDSMRGGWPW